MYRAKADPKNKYCISEILEKDLKAFDLTAISFCNENNIDSFAFGLSDPDNIYRAVMGEAIGTKMHK